MSGDANMIREALGMAIDEGADFARCDEALAALARMEVCERERDDWKRQWESACADIALVQSELAPVAAQRDALAEALEGLRAKRSLGRCWCKPDMILGGGLKHSEACEAARATLAGAVPSEEQT
jgi:hypothetical protein